MPRFALSLGAALGLIASGCGGAPALPLAIVAARNAADLVHRLLLERHDPNERDGNGLTPLMWAARSGAVEAMAALLDGGADVEVRDDRNGWTALFHAVHVRQSAAVRLLLDRGADPNAFAHWATPLMMAAADREPVFVELLLQYGADPHVRGIGGSTALSEAVSGGALADIDRPLLGGCRPATVRALLAHDPTLTLPNTIASREAIFWARLHGCADVLRLVRR